jgi:hypothetical protein
MTPAEGNPDQNRTWAEVQIAGKNHRNLSTGQIVALPEKQTPYKN